MNDDNNGIPCPPDNHDQDQDRWPLGPPKPKEIDKGEEVAEWVPSKEHPGFLVNRQGQLKTLPWMQ